MRMIFESDGQEDFFEIILSAQELNEIEQHKGITREFPYGLRNLNVFIRKQEHAISQRKSSEEP